MNRVILVGNLTRDPELTTTQSGVNVCKFTLAVSRRFQNANGERETDFLPIIVWRAQAETCAKYLRKGSKAGVVGSVQTRTYDAQDGTKRYVTEVVADEVEFLTSRSSEGGDFGGGDSYDAPRPAKKKTVAELTPVEDDDLPF